MCSSVVQLIRYLLISKAFGQLHPRYKKVMGNRQSKEEEKQAKNKQRRSRKMREVLDEKFSSL
jgi:hypothetical protein